VGQAYGKVGLTLVPTGVVGNWQYSANAAVTGAFMGFLSGYLAVERNVFSNLEETFVRGGWAPQTMIRTGNKQYVFLRAWLGVSHFSCKRRGENNDFCYLDNSGNKNEPESDVSGGGILVYKGKRLSSELDISYSRGDLSEGGKYSRFNANGSVSLRLGILFNRDMLHLKGNAVDYSGDAPGNVSGHVFYGVTW
jgi:hypothetical protein